MFGLDNYALKQARDVKCGTLVKNRISRVQDHPIINALSLRYDNLKYKYLSLKKFTRKEFIKRTEEELRKARDEADIARHYMAKKLTEVQFQSLNKNTLCRARCKS